LQEDITSLRPQFDYIADILAKLTAEHNLGPEASTLTAALDSSLARRETVSESLAEILTKIGIASQSVSEFEVINLSKI